MEDRTREADHLMPLNGDWAVWRWVGLRSAGFPIARLLELAAPDAGHAADALLAAEERVRLARDRAADALRFWDERAEARRFLRQIKRGRAPGAPWPAPVAAELGALEKATAASEAALANYRDGFGRAVASGIAALHGTASADDFREAVAWQNRHALRTGIDVMLRGGPGPSGRTARQRAREALVTGYVQRYCAKNDTIGFFGPVGWLRLANDGPALAVRPGPRLLAGRCTYLEGWCVDALCSVLAADGSLDPWLAPRRLPFLHVEGTILHVPSAAPVQLSPGQAAVLAAIDGAKTARDIARELGGGDAVMEVLAQLRGAGWIVWMLEVPVEGLHPERALRDRLARIEDDQLRDTAIAALDELESGRDAVARAAGNSDELDTAVAALEATFTRLTGAEATRRAGRAYAGRTIVYEDCRRDVEVVLGPLALRALGPPLALVLTSARWFTHEGALAFRRAFREIYERLSLASGTRAVPFSTFWLHAQALLFDDPSPPVTGLVAALQQRWAAILGSSGEERRIERSADQLDAAVRAAFPASATGWPAARQHSPDLMIAATSAQAVADGDFLGVLGEVHVGVNSLRAALFSANHPEPADLLDAMRRDLPDPVVYAVPTREQGGITPRTSNGLVCEKDLRLVFAHDTCGVPPGQALPIGDLVLEQSGGELQVRTHDGRHAMGIMEAVGDQVMYRMVQSFTIVPPADHVRRVSIDRLVIRREGWRLRGPDLAFAAVEDEAERFLALRRSARSRGTPRYVFARVAADRKPFYLDLDSPLSVDVFARAVRRAVAEDPESSVGLTEMLPGPDQAWLIDAQDRRYTSELRLVAVDLHQDGDRGA